MRFYCDGPDIPDLLLERRDQGRVVFLCGAGVSVGAGMPDFPGLTRDVMDFFDPPEDTELFKAFQPWRDAPYDYSIPKIPLDQIFQQLYRDYPRNEVNAVIAERLNAKSISRSDNHDILKRLSTDHQGNPQIVTTNFDRLFETGADGQQFRFYEPPAFPDINLGIPVSGITYLHGRLQESNTTNHPYILSSADLGRAYLAEGWATKFIHSLLKNYTVVMVGYSAEDPPVKYLLQGLNHDEKSDRSRLYAFDKGMPENIEAKWYERGVTPIAFSDFDVLWRTLEAWAIRADNPRAWHQHMISLAQKSPKDLTPSQRGQVCHLVSTVSGAKLFSRAQPVPPAEWLCVFDSTCRTKVRKNSFGESEQSQSPYDVYHIDSDSWPKEGSDFSEKAINLIRWHPKDSNSVEPDGLVNTATPEHYNISSRLFCLMQWINRVADSPIVAWWLFRQSRLHPSLLMTLKRVVRQNKSLPENARTTWNLLFHYHSTTYHDSFDLRWYTLLDRIKSEGWTTSVIRYAESVTAPTLKTRSLYGKHAHFPPSTGWDELRPSQLSTLEVNFGRMSPEKFDVPDSALYQVFRVFEYNLLRTVDLLNEIDIRFRVTPPLYHLIDHSSYRHDDEKFLSIFLQLFKRLTILSPAFARAHAETWSFDEQYYFCQLKLFALNQPQLFEGNQAIQAVLGLSQETLWCYENRLEILYLIKDRWADTSPDMKEEIITLLLNGRSDSGYDNQEGKYRYHRSCAYVTWLQQNGCDISQAQCEHLNLLTQKIDGWDHKWLESIEAPISRGGIVGINTNADSINNLPVSQIADAATAQTKHDFSRLVDHHPFTGLIQGQPCKALAALLYKARNNEYPLELWSELVDKFPKDVSTRSPRLYRVFLHRLKRLPSATILELAHTLSRWIEDGFTAVYNFDQKLAWNIFDHIVSSIQSDDEAKDSNIGDILVNGESLSSKTYHHAINGPIGKITRGLLRTLASLKLSSGQCLPAEFTQRFTTLLSSRGEGLDHTVCILSHDINWLYDVDPVWTVANVVPWVDFDHTYSEAAWNGLLSRNCIPHKDIVTLIGPQLTSLLTQLRKWHFDINLETVAAQILISLSFPRENLPPEFTVKVARNILRQMSDDNRQEAIRWLNIMGTEHSEKWEQIRSFIDSTWPRERHFRTASLSGRWVDLLSDTDSHFPEVYLSVKRFLVPTTNHSLYEFGRHNHRENTLTSAYPETVLDMLDRVTSNTISELPYQMSDVLPLIVEAQPELEVDHRYQRLIGLLEQV
ncbi:SIR2 family protein [Endozoicomonas acroporae]|uniref:SIR2 family protein n=1 Tax=Endozoicomonas acroporae TaxID=1701104 RepID=UPI003D7BC6E9